MIALLAESMPLISTLAIGLSAAVVAGTIAQRFGFSPILGYLLAGVAIGPHTPGFVGDAAIAAQLAEVGVILLMFGVGLHFSMKDLWEVRRIAITGALVQSAVATLLGVVIGVLAGWGVGGGMVFGLAISVASTVVLLRGLMQHRLLESLPGHVAIGWLIVEDLFTVLVLVVLPALAPGDGAARADSGLVTAILMAALRLAMLGVLGLVAARVVPWVLTRIARLGSRELFTLAVLAVALGIAFASAELFGVSMALGAFLGGLVVAQSDLSHQAAADALPLRDAFAVLFFLSIGMLFDPAFVVANPLLVVAALVLILVAKPLSAILIAAWLGYPPRVALTVGIGLAQIGEFSFILATLGHSLGLLPEAGRQTLLAAALLSIAVNPFLFRGLQPTEVWLRGQRWASAFFARGLRRPQQEPVAAEDGLRGHAVLCGYGRVGSVLGRVLRERGWPFLVVEQNRAVYEQLRADGVPAVFGDAANELVLERANLAHARILLVTIDDAFATRAIVAQAHKLNPRLEISVRVHSDEERDHFAQHERVVAVMGELELALEMARSMLEKFGVSPLEAQASVIDLRRGLGLRDADIEVMQLDVDADSSAAGKSIAQLGLGKGVLIVAIVRDQKLVVPTGQSVLAPDDRLLLLADAEARTRIPDLF